MFLNETLSKYSSELDWITIPQSNGNNKRTTATAPKKGKKMYTENQYDHMKFVINKLCIQTGLDKAQLIGIVLTNNDCVSYVESNSDHLYIIPRKELPRAIKEIEARDVGPFNDEHLQSAVLTLNVMNRKK